MIKFDKLLFNIMFGIAIPLLCFILSWWTAFIFTDDIKIIKIAALSGLSVGIVISLLIKLISKPHYYELSVPVLILVYLFYNGVLFAMFMGIPVFHLILGITAGYYWAKYVIHHKEITNYKLEIRRISVFATLVTGIVCFFSASIALLSNSTAEDLKGMLRLPFDITIPLLIAFILTGGILMIVIQYLLVKLTMRKTLHGN